MDYKVELLNTIFSGRFAKAYDFIDCLDDLADDDIKAMMAYGEYLRAVKEENNEKIEDAIQTFYDLMTNQNLIATFFYGLFKGYDGKNEVESEYLYEAVEELYQMPHKEAIHYHILGYFFHTIAMDMKRAISYYVRAADLGLYEALFILAVLYEDGTEVKRNHRKAFHWHLKGAEAGLVSSMVAVGHYYEIGKIVKRDYNEALSWYQKAADAGYPLASFNLGVCYFRGYGVKSNLKKAKEYFRHASENGIALAMYNLGSILRSEGNPEAVEWFEQAAAFDIGEALMVLGVMYEDGDLVRQDFERALSYYQEAKKTGVEDADGAIIYVEDCLKFGVDEADFRFCERAAELGNRRALRYLRNYYIDHQDSEKVVYWTKKAVDFGDRDGMFELAEMYFHGQYVEKNYSLALNYYIQASEKKQARSCYALGRIYLLGEGVDKDVEKAIFYLDKAIAYGYKRAYYIKGLIYESEIVDYNEAIKIYVEGASVNNYHCLNRLGEMMQAQNNFEEAFNCFERSAKRGLAEAQYNLAECYYHGIGTKPNQGKALSLFERMAKKGNKKAQKRLKDLKSDIDGKQDE